MYFNIDSSTCFQINEVNAMLYEVKVRSVAWFFHVIFSKLTLPIRPVRNYEHTNLFYLPWYSILHGLFAIFFCKIPRIETRSVLKHKPAVQIYIFFSSCFQHFPTCSSWFQCKSVLKLHFYLLFFLV